jgi:hypothetical protein
MWSSRYPLKDHSSGVVYYARTKWSDLIASGAYKSVLEDSTIVDTEFYDNQISRLYCLRDLVEAVSPGEL